MWMKVLLGILVSGLILNFVGYFLTERPDCDPPPEVPMPGEKTDAWRDSVGIVLVWMGRGMWIVAGIGLFLLGVRRSTFLGRPGY